jgi:large subunit ribosomal protein LX
MSEVKTFRITGEIKKPSGNIRFSKEIKGTAQKQAIETLYSELGSKHKAKRFEITIAKIDEQKSPPEETAKAGEVKKIGGK